MELIGRQQEIKELKSYIASSQPEFIAVYGRRRVGKTFLITQVIGNEMKFDVTGELQGKTKEHLFYFNEALKRYGYTFPNGTPRNWLTAFAALQEFLEKDPPQTKQVIFFDELPCFDSKNSGFLGAFEHFWNAWASRRPGLKLIVCGSATSWMVDNIVDNKGGLHNRLTHSIHLHPFTLKEVEQYLHAKEINWSRFDIIHTYMILGGIPYYLNLLSGKESLVQNIDRLCFGETDAGLTNECRRLYHSIFNKPEPYFRVITLLASAKEGLTRKEISDKLKLQSGGNITKVLRDLVNCDFVRSYNIHTKKKLSNQKIYQLVDFFTLFHFSFMNNATFGTQYWLHLLGTSKHNSWLGHAYERICMAHIPQIKKGLGIDRIYSDNYSWRSNGEQKAQIDLIIERADNIINLCEVKYSAEFYSINKNEYEKYLRRVAVFKASTQCRHSVLPTLITTFGLTDSKYNSAFPCVITLDTLFE